MASMVTSRLDARKSKRYQGVVLPAFTRINHYLVAWVYDGEVVFFVPRKYSTDAGFVCGCDADQGIPRTYFADDLAGGGTGRAGRPVCHRCLNRFGNKKPLA